MLTSSTTMTLVLRYWRILFVVGNSNTLVAIDVVSIRAAERFWARVAMRRENGASNLVATRVAVNLSAILVSMTVRD